MESTNPLRTIWGYRWWLLTFAGSAAVVVFLLSSLQSSQYEATATSQVVSGRAQAREFVSADELFQQANYTGWILLECSTEQPDKVKAMVAQLELFEKMLAG